MQIRMARMSLHQIQAAKVAHQDALHAPGSTFTLKAMFWCVTRRTFSDLG